MEAKLDAVKVEEKIEPIVKEESVSAEQLEQKVCEKKSRQLAQTANVQESGLVGKFSCNLLEPQMTSQAVKNSDQVPLKL
jgi:hypothetical protein